MGPHVSSLSTTELQKKHKLSAFALIIVGLGALIAFAAVSYRFFADGTLAITTLIVAVFALLAAIPVFKEKEQIQLELARRAGE